MNIYTGIVYLFACLCLLLPHLDDDTLLYMTVILLCVHEFMALVIYGAVHLEYLWNGGVPLVEWWCSSGAECKAFGGVSSEDQC